MRFLCWNKDTPLLTSWGDFVSSEQAPFARTVPMDSYFIAYEKELRALANRRRLKILFYLKRHKTAYVLEIADELEVSLKTASKHLRRLFDVGLLTRNQVGGEMHYRLVDPQSPHLKSLLNVL